MVADVSGPLYAFVRIGVGSDPPVRDFIEGIDCCELVGRQCEIGEVDWTSSPPTNLGGALYAPILEDPVQPANVARFIFLNEARARHFWPN